MPPPRQDVDVTKVFRINIILNSFQNLKKSPKHRAQADVLHDGNNKFIPKSITRRKAAEKSVSNFTLHTSLKKHAAFTLAEGATNAALSDNIRRVAFTLAEVLITLGIIGVVAALTLPSIISKYKKQVIATRLEQFASIYQQAIRMAEIEHGETIYWEGFEPYNADAMLASYNKYLGKYINTIDVYKTAKGVAFELSNGSGFHLHKTMNGQAWRGNLYVGFCVHYKNCKNIEEKGSASYDGKETFHFTEIGTPIRGLNGKILTRDELLEDCKTRHYTCSGLIQHDGWKISDDYPIRI